MGWSINDLIQFAQDLVGSDPGKDQTTDGAHGEFIYADDERSANQQSSNLTADEARQSLDEYEKILRS